VGDFQIKETIYRIEGFPARQFERFYEAINNGDAVDLGSFEDESDIGIVNNPIVHNNQLVVFSSAHVFFWQPGRKPVHFSPYEAAGWYEYSQIDQLNGHYDYLASDVWSHNGQLLLRYECDFCGIGKPEKLLFYSLDDGRTFDICQSPTPDDLSCLD
jgi:hypothetical protein